MRYVIEVLTESQLGSAPDWVFLASHDGAQPAIAAAAYEASKRRYPRVRLRCEDGHVIVDSGSSGLRHLEDVQLR